MKPRRRSSGLFRRIYATFVLTAVGTAAISALGGWWVSERVNQRWLVETLRAMDEENDAFVRALENPESLQLRVEELAHRGGTRVAVYDLSRRKIAGEGPPRLRHRKLRRRAHNREGRRRDKLPKDVIFPLRDTATQGIVGWVRVIAIPDNIARLIAVPGFMSLMILGLGAWSLSHSLTRRLSSLERSAGRIAGGDLGHRVALRDGLPGDELDHLALAFNDMAVRVEQLVIGQRTLLANVSHELRTPIARIKVLLEILDERIQRLGCEDQEERAGHHNRLAMGIEELKTDTDEIELLISDLLASGRLELVPDSEARAHHEELDLGEVATRIAGRFDARVTTQGDLSMRGDLMLVERMLVNLMSNARRHCHEGMITIEVERTQGQLRLTVEDEGPGIAREDRERIFKPFARLDDARTRDAGGVGLGLHLCRQIARAHGGVIEAQERSDGRPGARFQVQFEVPG